MSSVLAEGVPSTFSVASGSALAATAVSPASEASTGMQLLKFMTNIMNAHSSAKNFLPFIAQLSFYIVFLCLINPNSVVLVCNLSENVLASLNSKTCSTHQDALILVKSRYHIQFYRCPPGRRSDPVCQLYPSV